MPHAITQTVRARARAAFRSALAEAVPPFRMGQQELFTDEEEQFIQHEVDRKLYTPTLPNAGAQERKWVALLRKFAGDENLVVNIKAACWRYAQALESLLPAQEWIWRKGVNGTRTSLTLPGCYYARKSPITHKTNGDLYAALIELKAARKKDRNVRWMVDFLIEGLPVAVSNFKMECLYLLRGADGNVTRLVRLVSNKGEMSEGREIGGADMLPNEMYAGSEKFRQWVQSKGNFTWGGQAGAGNTELQSLQWDVTELAAYRVIRLIEYCGWHEIRSERVKRGVEEKIEPGKLFLRGIWFYDDCAITEGKIILPDADGIIWYDGEGYALSRKGRELEFIQGPAGGSGRPVLRPELSIENLKLEVEDWDPLAREIYQSNKIGGLFREVCRRFSETAGGNEGLIMIGAALGYAAAPEVFHQQNNFPSVWVSGQMGSGKSTLVSWLMSIFGLKVQAGMGLISKSVTAVGIACQLENYSNIPLWLDEFRQHQITPDKEPMLRDTYGRQLSGKWSPDGLQRAIRTMTLVSGESTSSDGATRSRYPHVLISEKTRVANHFKWFQAHQEFFFLIWREVMLRRAEFVERVLERIEFWMTHPDMDAVPSRDRVAHSVCFAAFSAASVLFESHPAAEVVAFRKFLVKHAASAAADVQTDVNSNVFIQELVVAYKAGQIPSEYFRVESTAVKDKFGFDWRKYRLYIEPQNTISALQIYLRKAGSSVTLKYKDLRDQLSKQSFWIRSQNGDPIKRRFGPAGSKTTELAWGFDVDEHPMGRQDVTLDEVLEATKKEKVLIDDIGLIFMDGDPRKGPLFSIIEGVEKYEKGESSASS